MNMEWTIRHKGEADTEVPISAPTLEQAVADYITARTAYRGTPFPAGPILLEVERTVACRIERESRETRPLTIRHIVMAFPPGTLNPGEIVTD